MCSVPKDAVVIDATGKWVIPGLIDTHVHLSWAPDGSAERTQLTRFAFGNTTTREAGTPGSLDRNLNRRAAAESPASASPRLVVSGLVSDEHMERFGMRDVSAVAHRLAGFGVDAIKIKQEFTAEELRAIVGEAHAHGLPVFGHTWGPSGSRLAAALAAGIDGLAHMFTFSEYSLRADAKSEAPGGVEYWVWLKEHWNHQDEAKLSAVTDRIVEQGVWFEPMLVTEKHFTFPYPLPDDVAYLGEVPTMEQLIRTSLPIGDSGWVKGRQRRGRIDAVYQRMCTFVGQFRARGGVIVTATDDTAPGPGLLDEIARLTECGFSPMAALRAATSQAAMVLKRPDIGTIEPGKKGDLVILDADPLADPANYRRVFRVVKGGHVHDPATLLSPVRSAHRGEMAWAWTARLGALGLVVGTLAGALILAGRLRRRAA